MEQAIIKRLDRSLFTYGKELDRGVSYVKDKSELNVLKKL
jgi:hypothetical protein